jgi:hypothetical protein
LCLKEFTKNWPQVVFYIIAPRIAETRNTVFAWA